MTDDIKGALKSLVKSLIKVNRMKAANEPDETYNSLIYFYQGVVTGKDEMLSRLFPNVNLDISTDVHGNYIWIIKCDGEIWRNEF